MSYSLYLKDRTPAESGDCTITDGLGRFCSFFWGHGAWDLLSSRDQVATLHEWMDRVESRLEVVLAQVDVEVIVDAVFPRSQP